jgi:hypothetical protein
MAQMSGKSPTMRGDVMAIRFSTHASRCQTVHAGIYSVGRAALRGVAVFAQFQVIHFTEGRSCGNDDDATGGLSRGTSATFRASRVPRLRLRVLRAPTGYRCASSALAETSATSAANQFCAFNAGAILLNNPRGRFDSRQSRSIAGGQLREPCGIFPASFPVGVQNVAINRLQKRNRCWVGLR